MISPYISLSFSRRLTPTFCFHLTESPAMRHDIAACGIGIIFLRFFSAGHMPLFLHTATPPLIELHCRYFCRRCLLSLNAAITATKAWPVAPIGRIAEPPAEADAHVVVSCWISLSGLLQPLAFRRVETNSAGWPAFCYYRAAAISAAALARCNDDFAIAGMARKRRRRFSMTTARTGIIVDMLRLRDCRPRQARRRRQRYYDASTLRPASHRRAAARPDATTPPIASHAITAGAKITPPRREARILLHDIGITGR